MRLLTQAISQRKKTIMDEEVDSKILLKINSAIADGEAITIIYDRGSKPGTSRQIAPLSIKGDTLRALCLRSGETKSFLVRAIRFHQSGDDIQQYDRCPGLSPIELLSLKKDSFEKLGWHVEVDLKAFCLHGYRKNSSVPLKKPTISLNHYPESQHFPWNVSGPSKGNSFKKPEKAIDLFMEEVRSTPPPIKK